MKWTEDEVLVGIDWGDEKHDGAAVDGAGECLGKRTFSHSGEGLEELCAWLLGLSQGDPSRVHVAIEARAGAVVETLLERGFNVYAINPKQVDRFRDRYSVAGAKDDVRDAYVMADSLRTDWRCFRRLELDQPTVIELRDWVRLRDERVSDRKRLTSRIRDQLNRYFPQYLKLGARLNSGWVLELWCRIPTPAKAARVRLSTVKAILDKSGVRRDPQQVLRCLRSRPLQVAPGVVEGASARLRQEVEQLRLNNRQERACDKRIDELMAQLAEAQGGGDQSTSDVEVLSSMPGAGRNLVSTLLTEASEGIRARDYERLRRYSGVAPVTRRTGKRRGRYYPVFMRRACNQRLREAAYHWGRTAMQRSDYDRARYQALRARGCTHGRACRQVADGLLRVACTLLQRGELYDPAKRGRKRPAQPLRSAAESRAA